jgi:hypothetical protein
VGDFTLALYADNSGTLGSLLETIPHGAYGTGPQFNGNLVTGTSSTHTPLVAGTRYWVVATTSSDFATDFDGYWSENTTGDTAPSLFFNGSAWQSGFSHLALRVTAVPEPASLALLGVGGAAALARRRRRA